MKPRLSLRTVVGPVAAILTAWAGPAQAANQTWDNGAATGNWNGADLNWDAGSAWTNGNTAIFGGTAGSTITINATGVSAAGLTFNVNNDVIAQSGGNSLAFTGSGLVTVGSGLVATVNAPLTGTTGMVVEGGGTLNLGGINTIDAGGDGTKGLIVGATTAGNTVNLSSGGTMGTITANRRSLYIGSSGSGSGLSTTGSNIVNLTTPGTSLAPTYNASGSGGRMTIGYASSSNELNVSNGAYLAQTNGGGTNTWDMGVLAGANNNKITVSGSGSTINFGSNQSMNIGVAGDGNSLTVSNGGYFRKSRISVGTNGGDNNYELITGTGSQVSGSATTNSILEIGVTANSLSNSLRVESGATLNFGGTGTSRRWGVGQVATADNNYISIKGSGTYATMVHTGIPLAIGGYGTGTSMTDGGSGNHLDVYGGATLDMDNVSGSNALVPTGSTAVVLLGTNSAFNLGNGTGTSTAYVGTTANFATGVYLKNSDGRLNIDSGRLVAAVTGNLVSGSGKVVLNGPAYFSSASGFTNTISTLIEGTGSLTKEGAGTLDLTQANTYTGDTYVTDGILKMENAYLYDTAAVYFSGTGKMNLNTGGATDSIGALYFNGVPQAGGTWGATGSGAAHINDTYFTGSGMLLVPVPEPGPALLGGLGVLAILRRRRMV